MEPTPAKEDGTRWIMREASGPRESSGAPDSSQDTGHREDRSHSPGDIANTAHAETANGFFNSLSPSVSDSDPKAKRMGFTHYF